MTLFPWQQKAWQTLFMQADRFPHALLLEGPEGTGKQVFAETLAQALLCLSADKHDKPCHRCQSCLWFLSRNHPDFQVICPIDEQTDTESVTKVPKRSADYIVIDQIRQLDQLVSQSTHLGGARVIIIYPADRMNPNAANAFLKKLEEPSGNTYYILVTAKKNLLLPTILSRCYSFCPGIATKEQSIAWLASKHVSDPEKNFARAQSPLLAIALASAKQDISADFIALFDSPKKTNPVVLAEQIEKILKDLRTHDAIELSVLSMQKICYDLIMDCQSLALRYHPDLSSGIRKLSKKTDLASLMRYDNMLIAYKKEANHPLNLKLFLEQLLLDCPFL